MASDSASESKRKDARDPQEDAAEADAKFRRKTRRRRLTLQLPDTIKGPTPHFPAHTPGQAQPPSDVAGARAKSQKLASLNRRLER